jgi:hypothetical protein
MSEGLRIRDVITNPRVIVTTLLASLAFAGCGVTKSSDKIPLGACGRHDYSHAETPAHDKAQILATAKHDVLTLQHLALRVGGSIDLTRYGGNSGSNEDVREVTASEDNLQLSFDRSWFVDSPRVDHVDFPISGNEVFISEGTVMCYEDNHQLVTNGTYTSLQDYVHQTSP